MPRTEAGKRLLERRKTGAPRLEEDFAAAIDAIEAEACHHDARWIEQFTAWCVAAERARIRAAVEGLFDSPALYPSFWGDTIRKENEVVRAVLRIIDGEDTDA